MDLLDWQEEYERRFGEWPDEKYSAEDLKSLLDAQDVDREIEHKQLGW